MAASVGDMGRHWATYSVGSMLSRVLGFVMVPVYTRYLSPDDYGVLELVTASTAFFGIVLAVGLGGAVIRFYRDDAGRVHPEVVSSALIVATALSGLGVAAGLWFAEAIAHAVLGSAVYAREIRLALVTVQLGLALGLNVLFVVGFEWGVVGILVSNLVTAAVMALGLAGWTVREVGRAVSARTVARLLRYGAPAVGAASGWFVINFADRFFLTSYGSLGEVGIYSLANRLAMAVLFLSVEPLRQAWEPLQFEVARDPASARLFPRMFELVVAVLGAVGVIVCLFADEVVRLLTPAPFWAAASVVPPLVLAVVLVGLLQPFHTGIAVRNRTEVLSAVMVVGVGVNLAANYLVVPLYGARGAAAARVLSFLVIVTLAYRASQRLFAIDFQVSRALRLLAYAVGLVVLGGLVPAEPLAVSLGLKVVALLVFGWLASRSLARLDPDVQRLAMLRRGLHRVRAIAGRATR